MKAKGLSRRGFLGATGSLAAAGMVNLPMVKSAFAQDTTLKLWDQFTADPQYGVVEQLVSNYQDANPAVNIERSAQPGSELTTIGKTALSSGTGPDIIYYQVGQGNAGLLADADLIIPIEDYAEQYGWMDKLAPFARQAASLNGQLYGVPHETEVVCLFVNKTLIEQAGLTVPKTFDELLTFATSASEKGLLPMAYGQGDIYPSWWALGLISNAVMGAQGTVDLVYNNEGAWNTPQMVEAIEKFFVGLPEAGAFIPEVNALAASDAWALFLGGGALMAVNGSWAVGSVQESMPDAEIDMIALPVFDSSKPAVFPAGAGSAFYISAASDNPDAAAEFMNYLITPEANRLWVEQGSVIPPVEFDSSSWDLAPLTRRAIEAASTGYGTAEENLGASANHGLAGPTFLQAMTNGFQAMMSGDKTAQQQADELQSAWEEDQAG